MNIILYLYIRENFFYLKRKSATANVNIFSGSGIITINGKSLEVYVQNNLNWHHNVNNDIFKYNFFKIYWN